MRNRSGKENFVLVFAFLLGLGLGCWLNAKARIVWHVLKCTHFVYFVGDSRERPHTLEYEVGKSSQLLLVGVFVDKKEVGKKTGILYNDFSPETNIKFIFFTTNKTMSLHNMFVALDGLDGSKEPKLKYLQMLNYFNQHYGDKFNWFLFTESKYFVNMDKLGFLKYLHYSKTKEFLFLPQIKRKSGINDYGDVLLDSFTKKTEYQKSKKDIFHVIQPGMILSRSLLKRVSSSTKSCMNKRQRGLRKCLQKIAAIFWMTDFEVLQIFLTS